MPHGDGLMEMAHGGVLAPLMEVVMKINSMKARLTCENISCNWAALTVIGF